MLYCMLYNQCPYLEGITVNNSCILATLSHDCYIKHTCKWKKKIAPILPPGRVAAASVICIGCLWTLPQHSWQASSVFGGVYSREVPEFSIY